jgi:hypothetical protein
MLVVVFGAGATYDSAPSWPAGRGPLYAGRRIPVEDTRPPLANQLFDDRRAFRDVRTYFPALDPIVPYLMGLPSGVELEEVLERLQTDERNASPLAAVRHYLSALLRVVVQKWMDEETAGVTSYLTLLHQVEANRHGERVCLVTFNYDVMLDRAFQRTDREIKTIDEYVGAGSYDLVKVHGSIDWGQVVTSKMDSIASARAWDLVDEVIAKAHDLKLSDEIRLVRDPGWPIWRDGDTPLVPAVAIPLRSKRDFVCPKHHVAALDAALDQCDRLVVIGWRATDKPFMELLKARVGTRPPTMIVCANQSGETRDALVAEGIGMDHVVSGNGFTEGVRSREIERFLNR